jgi:hypothetical protein
MSALMKFFALIGFLSEGAAGISQQTLAQVLPTSPARQYENGFHGCASSV